MTAADLKNLLERIQNWPEEAQDELVSVANEIEDELQGRKYVATQEELRVIDSARLQLTPATLRRTPKSKQRLQNFVRYEARLFASGPC